MSTTSISEKIDVRDQVSAVWEFLNEILIGYCSCFEEVCNVAPKDEKLYPNVELFLTKARKFRSGQCNMIIRNNDVQQLITLFARTGLIKQTPNNSFFEDLVGESLDFKNKKSSHRWTFSSGRPITWKALKESVPHDDPIKTCFCYNLQTPEFINQINTVTELLMKKKDSTSSTSIKFNSKDIHQLAHVLFWYFRKGVVDMMLKGITRKSNIDMTHCTALSVGSTNITSDYDVTVNDSCADLIGAFSDEFESIFGATSDVVFDTNLYGSSIILNTSPREEQLDIYKEINCAIIPELTQKYWVLSPSAKGVQINRKTGAPEYIIQQYQWALLKLAYGILASPQPTTTTVQEKIRKLFDVILELWKKSPKVSSDPHVDEATNGNGKNELSPLPPRSPHRVSADENNDELRKEHNRTYSQLPFKVGSNEFEDVLDNLSYVNSKGTETYYTRAAIVDVVINQQTCRNMNTPIAELVNSCKDKESCPFITLNYDEYTQSVFEQFSDFIYHKKNKKYLTRIASAFKNMNAIGKVTEKRRFDALDGFISMFEKTKNSKDVPDELILELTACIVVLLRKVTETLESEWKP